MNEEMTAQEREEFRQWKERKEREERRASELESYRKMVDDAIDELVPQVRVLAEDMSLFKQTALETFRSVVAMKREAMGLAKDGQRSHTFTHSDGSARVVLGVNTTDGYHDTVEEGIDMVSRYIESLATDANSKNLVAMVMRLLAKDTRGNLKASRVVQLRRLAEESGSEEFMAGVKLIEDSYLP